MASCHIGEFSIYLIFFHHYFSGSCRERCLCELHAYIEYSTFSTIGIQNIRIISNIYWKLKAERILNEYRLLLGKGKYLNQ